MRLKSWFLGMVRRFWIGGFIPRFLRPFRPRSAIATIRSAFRRRRHVALSGTMRGSVAEARARHVRRQKIRNAVRFSPRIGTLEPRVMLSANDGSSNPNSTYTFLADTFLTGVADVLEISSETDAGHQWGVIKRRSDSGLTELERFRGYQNV